MPNRDKASTPRARLVLSATTDQGEYDGTGPYDASLEKKAVPDPVPDAMPTVQDSYLRATGYPEEPEALVRGEAKDKVRLTSTLALTLSLTLSPYSLP